jgi:hypothetical protein
LIDRSDTHAAHEAFDARETTLALALILFFVEGAFAIVERGALDGPLSWIYATHAILAGGIALVLYSLRTLDPRWSLAAFVALVLPLLPIFWISESLAISAGRVWHPFIGRKLILLGLALLTPWSSAAAAAFLTAFMIESIAVWLRLDRAHHMIATTAGEPWVTFVFFVAALLIVVQRRHRRRLEHELLDAQREMDALRQLVEVSTAVRDQVNTPLQTLELSIALLARRHPEEQRILERMTRSLRRLVRVSRSFDRWTAERDGITQMRAIRNAGAELERSTSSGTSSGPSSTARIAPAT